eukprot:4773739-Amphidinium_carterae.1
MTGEDWLAPVVITLADGSSLTLTSDHPTQPRRALGELPLSGHVPACDLKAGSDSLMVPRRAETQKRIQLQIRKMATFLL